MYQLNLLLLHVKLQDRAKHDFDLQLTANISLFFLPFWGLYCEYFTVFWEIYFCFFAKEIFFKIEQDCFSSEMSLRIAQQSLSCSKTRLGFLKCFSKPR